MTLWGAVLLAPCILDSGMETANMSQAPVFVVPLTMQHIVASSLCMLRLYLFAGDTVRGLNLFFFFLISASISIFEEE